MSSFVDLTGRRFGRLTVVERVFPNLYGKAQWRCKCDCSNEIIACAGNLVKGNTTSCGCYRLEQLREAIVHDLTGRRFGRLTVVGMEKERQGGKIMWRCLCDCGNYTSVVGHHLCSGDIVSCGCYLKDILPSARRKYSSDLERSIARRFSNIKSRCYNSNTRTFRRYGGRGIKICDEWLNDPKAFVDWAINNGYDPSLSIDRIDNDGPYAPWNCRWVSNDVQALNKSTTTSVTLCGESKPKTTWAKQLKMSSGKVSKLSKRFSENNLTNVLANSFVDKIDETVSKLIVPGSVP